jgi:YggT family protein
MAERKLTWVLPQKALALYKARLQQAAAKGSSKMDSLVGALVEVILVVLDLYTWVIIAAVIASWLVNFGVINIHNQFARMIVSTLIALTEPLFAQIRRILPPFGNLDLSPIVVLLGIFFIQRLLVRAFLL